MPRWSPTSRTRRCTQKVTIAGKHCECDNLIFDLMLPEVAPGDILAVQTTGAYNYTMSSNYNRFTRPAVVLVQRRPRRDDRAARNARRCAAAMT